MAVSIYYTLLLATLSVASPTHRTSDQPSVSKRASPALHPLQYGKSANGHTSAARGWNSWGFDTHKNEWGKLGYDRNVYHFGQQCDQITTRDGFDYYCSIDSGWSLSGGDPSGLIVPDPTVWNSNSDPKQSITDFASHLNDKNIRLGIYILPGAFTADSKVNIPGTSISLGSRFNTTTEPNHPGISNSFNARNALIHSSDTQKWYDANVKQFANWGVELLKLDYITPGSDFNPDCKDKNGNTLSGDAYKNCVSQALPWDTSGDVAAYHQAIQNLGGGGKNKFGRQMRLDISWRLDFDDEKPWNTWKANADSLRLDRDDISSESPADFGVIQRTIERYRRWINQQALNPARQNQPILIRPDMDNLWVGNKEGHQFSQLTDVQRYTQAILWVGAGANLITGSDMNQIDDIGKKLLYDDDEFMDVASFTSNWPMVPRNTDDAPTPGGGDARQLSAWIAGPNDQGTAVVILSNLGEDQCLGNGANDDCSYGTEWHDVHLVSISLDNLGIGGSDWFVRRISGGGSKNAGSDHTDIGKTTQKIECNLDHYESVMYKLQKCGTGGVQC